MRTVTSRKELIAGIKSGERRFKVKGKSLVQQCVLASKFNSVAVVTTEMVTKALSPVYMAGGFMAPAASTVTTIALGGMAVVGTIAIIAILKERKVKIRLKNRKGDEVEIEVY